MKKLGDLAKTTSSRSQQVSKPAPPAPRREWRPGNLPISYDHFVDKAIPGRVWAAFIPDDGTPRKLRRPLADAERNAVALRARELGDCLRPFDAAERDGVAGAIMGLLASFGAGMDKATAIARTAGYIESLGRAGYPAWAIEQTCISIRNRGYVVREGDKTRLEMSFAPNEPRLCAAVGEVVEQRRKAYENARLLLAAEIDVEAEDDRDPARVERALEEWRQRIGPHDLAEIKATEASKENRRQEIMKRALEDRERAFIAEGIDVPAGKTSLSMYLHMGWTIEDHGNGRRVLVAPPERFAPPKKRETQTHEMGS